MRVRINRYLLFIFFIFCLTENASSGIWVANLHSTMRDEWIILGDEVYELDDNTMEASFMGLFADNGLFKKDELYELAIPDTITINLKKYAVTKVFYFGWQSFGKSFSGEGKIPRHFIPRLIIPPTIKKVEIHVLGAPGFSVGELIIEDGDEPLYSKVTPSYRDEHHPEEWSPYGNWEINGITKGYIGRNILGYSPFSRQTGIKSIEFGPNVTIIPHNFLYGSSVEEDSGLLSFKFPEGTKIVGDHAFASNNINHFVGLDCIEEIGEYAFMNKEFETLDLSAAKHIGKKAFLQCRNLKEVIFSSDLTEIGDSTFFGDGTSLMTDLIIPKNVKKIGKRAFYGYNWLRNITFLGDEKPDIDPNAFGSQRLKNTSCFFPNGDSSWGSFCFNHVICGKQISLNVNLERSGDLIMYLPLDSLDNVTSLKISGAELNQTDVEAISKLKNLITLDLSEYSEVPYGIKKTYGSALQHISWIPDESTYTPFVHEILNSVDSEQIDLNVCCLESFVISDKVKSISLSPFGPFFSNLYCETEYPPMLEISDSMYEYVTLYIPRGSYPRYWLNNKWNKFKSIVEYDKSILVSSLTINQESVDLKISEIVQLTCDIKPDDATDKTLTWSSDNENVAIVDDNGNVTALGIGTAIITAKTNDGSNLLASCNIMVFEPEILVSSISLNPSSVEGKEGEQIRISATIFPDDATNQIVTWSSSDESVATVDDSGLLSLFKEGTALITASATDESGVSASCEVTVFKPETLVSSISLNPSSVEGKEGEQIRVTATILPDDATNQIVTWSSSDESVATVDDSGLLSLFKEGTALITASATDESGVSASCEVTVFKPETLVSSISLNPSSVEGKEGEQIRVTATILPDDATNQIITWSSSDESVAAVDDSGVISLLRKGTAVITVSATDKSGIYAQCSVVVTELSGIKDVLTDDSTYVKIFNLNGVLVYEGIYADANLVSDYYIVVCDGNNIKVRIE